MKDLCFSGKEIESLYRNLQNVDLNEEAIDILSNKMQSPKKRPALKKIHQRKTHVLTVSNG